MITQLNQRDVNLGESQKHIFRSELVTFLLQAYAGAQPGAFPRGRRLAGDHVEFQHVSWMSALQSPSDLNPIVHP